jgi:hypothetical protein
MNLLDFVTECHHGLGTPFPHVFMAKSTKRSLFPQSSKFGITVIKAGSPLFLSTYKYWTRLTQEPPVASVRR